MNTDQIKLTKSEWNSIEIPLNPNEINIVKFIYNSFNNVNIKENHNYSLISFLKLENNDSTMNYIFIKYFQNDIMNIYKKNKIKYNYHIKNEKKHLSKADIIDLKIQKKIFRK